MSWNRPDAYSGETEQQYWARKDEEEAVRTEGNNDLASVLMMMLVKFFIFFLYIATVFGVFIYAGHLLSQKILGDETDKFKIWGFSILFTYLIMCVIYFLKGIIIGLRINNRKLWILPWMICVLFCCIVPALIIKSLVISMFHLAERESLLCVRLSWGAFVVSLLYIYSIYQFKTPNAPRIFNWSYAYGFKVTQ